MNEIENKLTQLKSRTEYLKNLLAELEANIKDFKSDCKEVNDNWKKMWEN